MKHLCMWSRQHRMALTPGMVVGLWRPGAWQRAAKARCGRVWHCSARCFQEQQKVVGTYIACG
jgi:hypothetical protein